MCQILITITDSADQVQRVWVRLPNLSATFTVRIDAARGAVITQTFQADGVPEGRHAIDAQMVPS